MKLTLYFVFLKLQPPRRVVIWLFWALLVNCPLKDILTGRNASHKYSGNFKKMQVLILFSSHWWAWYSIFPLWLLYQQPFWKGLSTEQSCWTCRPKGSYLLYLLQQYRLVWEAAAYLHIFYRLFYNNNNNNNNNVCFCFSKYHHWGEEHLYIYNFQGEPLVLTKVRNKLKPSKTI